MFVGMLLDRRHGNGGRLMSVGRPVWSVQQRTSEPTPIRDAVAMTGNLILRSPEGAGRPMEGRPI